MIRIFNRKYSKKTMLLISEIIISFLGLLTFPIKGEQAWFIAFFIISLLQLILHIFYKNQVMMWLHVVDSEYTLNHA